MRAYLMTRGFPRQAVYDYNFLGESPPDRWWRPFVDRRLVDVEEPIVLARGADGSLSMLLSGLPSARRDVVDTPIRHTLVVDGLGTELAGRLAATGLDPDGRHRLGKELDKLFPGDMVDAVLSGAEDGAGVGESLDGLLASRDWATEPAGGAADLKGSWAAPLGDRDGQAAFLARIAALAGGRNGDAFVTHSLTSAAGVERAAAGLPGDCAILVADGNVRGMVMLGKGRAAPAAPTRPGARMRPVPLTTGLSAVVLIAVIVLTILLL
ncbi:hypothetical protein [Actinomadura sp. BRA 177]|uniref:hypothetical protein n=1 Tax=Actinomadura sp. BRA 177 TaxID=2745202 RepID=UPI001595898A|nr:hypothetical protein [Actinomadura sp. BRA 177]NVI92977.1 hypothetical protein [Actinomadura sp. BRA 177]